MTEVKQWIRNRRAEGMLWKEIRQELMKYNYSFVQAIGYVNQVRAEVEQETDTHNPTNILNNQEKSDTQQQQAKPDNRITIRLTPEEIDFIGKQYENPSGVIHKALMLAIQQNIKET